jgi:Protein of unknown function (DUF2524)
VHQSFGGKNMTTRQSVEKLLQQCEDSLRFAKDQLSEGQKQEHYNDSEYVKAQQGLENAYKELEEFSHSANAQQRDQLYRMRLQIQNLQNEMVLTDH